MFVKSASDSIKGFGGCFFDDTKRFLLCLPASRRLKLVHKTVTKTANCTPLKSNRLGEWLACTIWELRGHPGHDGQLHLRRLYCRILSSSSQFCALFSRGLSRNCTQRPRWSSSTTVLLGKKKTAAKNSTFCFIMEMPPRHERVSWKLWELEIGLWMMAEVNCILKLRKKFSS